MSWIDERVQQRRRLAERNKAVAEAAEVLFNDLWVEITAQAKEAQEKSVAVGTDGSAHERIVWAPNVASLAQPMNRRELKISLRKEVEQISVSGTEFSMNLSVTVGEDGVVCLKHNGEPVLIQEAARLILDQFLFPEFQTKKP
ncbi:hypothetical protein SBA2_860010 [Acidobacteriia bacterium SbA2]|nr:hypothetical protein SBA2_860010 [Acidobacteriia bacterium SbA2]